MNYQINLLTKKKENSLNRAVYFSLNYLRYILVITQIVVITVFLIKFKVDQDIIDLQESVNQKKEIVRVSQPLLTLAKSAHAQSAHIETVLVNQDTVIAEIEQILALFPSTLFLKSINLTDNAIELNSISNDVTIVKLFINQLKKNTAFKMIELKTIKKTDEGFDTTIRLSDYKTITKP